MEWQAIELHQQRAECPYLRVFCNRIGPHPSHGRSEGWRRSEDAWQSLRIQRQAPVVITHQKVCRRLVENQQQPPLLELLTVLIAKDGQEQLVTQFSLERLPINIKVISKCAGATILQHIPPPGVVLAYADMVRHDVENQSHTVCLQFSHK